MLKVFGAAAAGLVLLAGCTSTGNIERNTAGGAALGAIAGGVIGNNVGDGDAQRGAAIGAVLGGAAGAARGSRQDAQCGGTEFKKPAAGQELIYDRSAQRYYYIDRSTGKTYWNDGSLRSC
ncbi:YMGG-like glycine zipper-containing protein [Parvularcula marina]|uniref:Glycine zipper 2TM domain-containing protein n=1 Tax=Parvularcula marina TaxID=2292771 RepID=A0A371RGR2_9PROT|nr:YMGG-like glycine zipper-containing protein [Parvularcula marina]RFB04640.1 glycine zipper 2TM domain-containing protein [Parvularcula marina]